MKSPAIRALAFTAMLVVAAVSVHHAQAPATPTGLNSQVNGNFVAVSWNPVPGAVSYMLQAGTSPGASNLFSGVIGNVTSASGTLGSGTYFWRVSAIGPSGQASPPSADATFTVGGGGGGCVPPGPPQAFSATVSGVRVTLRWGAPASGGAPTTYIIEAGSSPGLANLFNAPTGNAGTELSVDAPPGRYFARLRSQNACGTSGVSNEQQIDVGGGSTNGCSYALSPASAAVPLGGGPLQVSVTAPGGCRWQLQSDAFISPTSTSGSGSASINYSVGGTGAPRSGRISLVPVDPGPVAVPQVLVQQSAPTSCSVTLSPPSQTVSAAAATYEFRVIAAPGCPWSLTPMAGFISIVSSGQQSGTDNVQYRVLSNAALMARSGLIRVTSSTGFQDFSVTQQAVAPLSASFVMREGGQETVICQVNQGGTCTLDASSSTPSGQITSYEWRTVRYLVGNQTRVDTYTGVNPTLDLDCTVGGNSQEAFEVTLTVRDAVGQSNTLTRGLSLVRAGCGT
jgi:hypothetical protein